MFDKDHTIRFSTRGFIAWLVVVFMTMAIIYSPIVMLAIPALYVILSRD